MHVSPDRKLQMSKLLQKWHEMFASRLRLHRVRYSPTKPHLSTTFDMSLES